MPGTCPGMAFAGVACSAAVWLEAAGSTPRIDENRRAVTRHQRTRQIFSMLVPPGAPMGSPQVMA